MNGKKIAGFSAGVGVITSAGLVVKALLWWGEFWPGCYIIGVVVGVVYLIATSPD